MYNYLLGQWRMGRVSATYIQARVSKFISQAECEAILATPQDLIGIASVIEAI